MKPALCERFGIDFPLFAFTHCCDVVAALMNAGNFGVLRLFDRRRGGDHSDLKRENAGCRISKQGPLTQQNRQANAPVTVELDGRLAC